MKKFILLLSFPLFFFSQINQDLYTEIAQINTPSSVDKYLSIYEVLFTPDDKYFVVNMGYKPSYFAVYELETQKYITLFKVPGWADYLYYKDDVFYTSNGKSQQFKLSINDQSVNRLKKILFEQINPSLCNKIKIKSQSSRPYVEECIPYRDYLFCWKYIGDVLKIMKTGCVFGDCINGQGTYTYANGDIYEGEWKNDKRNGTGTYTFGEGTNEGDVYTGDFKDNLYHGNGTYTWVSGDKYVGEYRDDQEHGQGTMNWASGQKYAGEWKDGEMSGQGTIILTSGDKYVGEFKDSSRNGNGTYTWTDGTVYVGEWKNDKRNGTGTLTWPDGETESGYWQNGELIEK